MQARVLMGRPCRHLRWRLRAPNSCSIAEPARMCRNACGAGVEMWLSTKHRRKQGPDYVPS
jgi:hypothetical protein